MLRRRFRLRLQSNRRAAITVERSVLRGVAVWQKGTSSLFRRTLAKFPSSGHARTTLVASSPGISGYSLAAPAAAASGDYGRRGSVGTWCTRHWLEPHPTPALDRRGAAARASARVRVQAGLGLLAAGRMSELAPRGQMTGSRQPASGARRGRARKRTGELEAYFCELRSILPEVPDKDSLSKAELLHLAADYISYLTGLLQKAADDRESTESDAT